MHFGAGLACLDLDGTVRWIETYPDFVTSAVFGAGSSPVIANDAVFVVQEREQRAALRSSFVAAYALDTGELLWRCEPAEAKSSYGTPLILESGDSSLLVLASWRQIVAYDTRTGERVAVCQVPVEEVVSSMVADGTRIYLSGGSIQGGTFALKLPDGGDAFEIVWSNRRATASCSSPVLVGSRLFTISSNGIMSCYDAASGDALWSERIGGGDYFASLVAADGMIYACDEQGETVVVRAHDEFELITRNVLDGAILASPAISAGRLLIRSTSGASTQGTQ